MSFNGSGTFVINSTGQPVVTGTVISSSTFNSLTADLGTGLSTAITKDGQTTTTAKIPFAQGLSAAVASNFAAGTVGAPSIYLSTDTTTGLYRIGANNVGFAVSGVKLLDLGSALVGITGALTVSTTLGVTGTSTTNIINASKTTGGDTITFTNAAANNKTGFLYTDNDVVGLFTLANGQASANGVYFTSASAAVKVQVASSGVIGNFTSTGLSVTGTLGVTGAVSSTSDLTTSGGNISMASGQLGLIIGAFVGRSVANPTNAITLYNGTAPVGTMTGGVQFYSTAGEARVMDASGNATLLSPHDSKTNEWIYDSVDTRTGKVLHIRMEAMMKAINDKFGWDFINEYTRSNK